jgi:hypothetical protein
LVSGSALIYADIGLKQDIQKRPKPEEGHARWQPVDPFEPNYHDPASYDWLPLEVHGYGYQWWMGHPGGFDVFFASGKMDLEPISQD